MLGRIGARRGGTGIGELVGKWFFFHVKTFGIINKTMGCNHYTLNIALLLMSFSHG
jgi:hypothetical protein